MVKTAVGGDDKEPNKPDYQPEPKPAMTWAAMQRTQEFLDYHFNDRRKNNSDWAGKKEPKGMNQPEGY